MNWVPNWAADRGGTALAVPSLLAVAILATVAGFVWPTNPAQVFPPNWQIDLMRPMTHAIRFVSNDISVGGVAINEMTRALARIIEWPLLLIQGLLAEPQSVELPLLGSTSLPVLPWSLITVLIAIFSHWAGGIRLMALSGGTLAYFAMLGLWTSAMYTLSAVIVSVACGVLIGVLVGVAAYRHPRFEAFVNPVYDTLQTLPVFSYLVPLVVFLGLGPVTALIATIIYAMPPMARITTLTLREAPATLGEFARMAGCTPSAVIWRVVLPSRLRDLLVGVNQVIMLSLATVVIASTIGAGGLGNDVLRALKSLRFGLALEAGFAITLMAITMDRMSRALAARRPNHLKLASSSILGRRAHIIAAIAATALLTIASAILPPLHAFPENWTLSSSNYIGQAVQDFNREHAAAITAVRDWMTVSVMRPVRDLFTGMSWFAVAALASAAGVALFGLRGGAWIFGGLSALAVAGLWPYAMLSLYLVTIASIIALCIGVPIGMLAAQFPRVGRVVDIGVDTLQTLPAFVYLIPSVVLFSVGELPALLSIVLYAIAPAIRYTKHGLGVADPSVLEAAAMAGASPVQVLTQVKIPLAMPQIILGASQTLVMAFSMLAITSLVGSRGLEILTLEALGKVDPGKGLVAGLGIVVLTIVADRLMSGAASRWNWRTASVRR